MVQMDGIASSAEDVDNSVANITARLLRVVGGSTIQISPTYNTGNGVSHLQFGAKDTYAHNGSTVTYYLQARKTGGGDDEPIITYGTYIIAQEII